MFIHVDRAVVRKWLGRVADYCLICHSRQPFGLTRRDYCTRLFLIPVGVVRYLGHERECEGCGQTYPADPGEYTAVVRDRRCGLDTLIAETNPGLEGGLAGELRANERLRLRPVAGDDRGALLLGPFHAVRPLIEDRLATGRPDFWSESSVGVLILVGAPLAAFAAIGDDKPFRPLAAVVAGALVVISLVVVVTEERRFMRRIVRPRLRRALAPFGPTPDELQALAATDPTVRRVGKWVPLRSLCPGP